MHSGEVAVSEKTDDKRGDKRGDDLQLLAETMAQKPRKGISVDEMSLESRRRAIAYGRARGNA